MDEKEGELGEEEGGVLFLSLLLPPWTFFSPPSLGVVRACGVVCPLTLSEEERERGVW